MSFYTHAIFFTHEFFHTFNFFTYFTQLIFHTRGFLHMRVFHNARFYMDVLHGYDTNMGIHIGDKMDRIVLQNVTCLSGLQL